MKRRKRARTLMRVCVTLAFGLFLSCVIICPMHRLATDSLLPQEEKLSPHSLESQLLKSKTFVHGVPTAKQQMAASAAHNNRQGKLERIESEAKQSERHVTTIQNQDILRVAAENASVARESSIKDDLHIKPQPNHESTDNKLRGGSNITVMKEFLREMAMNSSLAKGEPSVQKKSHEKPAPTHESVVAKLVSQPDIANISSGGSGRVPASTRESHVLITKEADTQEDRHEKSEPTRESLPANHQSQLNNITSKGEVPAPTRESRGPEAQEVPFNVSSRVSPTQEKNQLTNTHRHYPSYFTEQVPLSSLKTRMNLLTPYTGCSIAAFQYNLGKHAHPEFNDCFVHCGKPFARTRGIRVDNAKELVKENDTIFVQFNKLDHFVNKTMDLLDVDYVIMTGNEQKVPPISRQVFDAIVNNPRVIHWFMSNVDVYSHDVNHPKVRVQSV